MSDNYRASLITALEEWRNAGGPVDRIADAVINIAMLEAASGGKIELTQWESDQVRRILHKGIESTEVDHCFGVGFLVGLLTRFAFLADPVTDG